jgi:peptidoglycan-associated lipoprotein
MSERSLNDANSMLKDPRSPLSKRSIYYDFDAYNIKKSSRRWSRRTAKFLLEHKDMKMRVEGNCDERGSREYNLALGQRRADSVKRALTAAGRARQTDRDGQLRFGKAQGDGPRR